MAYGQGSSNIFAIGDIHGCAEELKALLRKLPLDRNSTLLFLGDYVDRGPDAKGVIETILDLGEIYNVIALRGNHEWLFTNYLANPSDAQTASNFILNGGSSTLVSYSSDGISFKIPSSHREFLSNLRLFHTTHSHFYVHAGVPPGFDFSHTENLDEKTSHQLMWIRGAFLDSKAAWPKTVVHGHTPVKVVENLPNRINLDTGCVFGGRLTAMNMSTGEIYDVPRDEAATPKSLGSTVPGGQFRPERFMGEIAVDIQFQGRVYPFRTVNFNEFGLLIFPLPGSEQVKFDLGAKVKGLIRPNADSLFGFEGVVMRTALENGKQGFGIKFDRLENLKETSPAA